MNSHNITVSEGQFMPNYFSLILNKAALLVSIEVVSVAGTSRYL